VLIHVLAEQASLNGDAQTPGYLPGFGPLPASALRKIATTAKIKPLAMPSTDPEPGYRPSTALAEFVRLRDVTCRFPGCDEPAEVCDIDHTVPYPQGPTHPSNCKLLCRYHHLLKTFWTAWHDVQLPDGTVQWTSPTGHLYTTEPGASIYFPSLAASTGKLVLPSTIRIPSENRGLMMPARRHTRALERAARITAERRINEAAIAAETARRRIAARNDPPPF
jgi:hypothetical protein